MGDPIHRARAGRCIVCGKPWPCPTSLAAREPGHQVVASADVLARDLEHQLRVLLDALAALERELSASKGHDVGAAARQDAIGIARKHVQAAVDALELAARS
jgi:hypothetical protein